MWEVQQGKKCELLGAGRAWAAQEPPEAQGQTAREETARADSGARLAVWERERREPEGLERRAQLARVHDWVSRAACPA